MAAILSLTTGVVYLRSWSGTITGGTIRFADGSASAPSIAFASAPNYGFYLAAADAIRASAGNADAMQIKATQFAIRGTLNFDLGNNDLFLTRDAANVLAQRNGTNAQTFKVYETFTDASNNSYAFIQSNPSAHYFGTAKTGSGTLRPLIFYVGADTWQITTGGNFVASTDNSIDIGTSGANRPRNYFGAGDITVGGSISATGGTSDITAGRDLNLGANRYVAWASGASSLLTAPNNGDFQLSNSTATNKLTLNLGNTAQNGQSFGLINVLTELTTIAAAATTTTTIQMPANSVVLGVSVRVTTVIPDATSFSVGDSGNATRFSTANVSVAAGSTDPGTKAAAYYNASATGILLTMNGGTPATNTGRVRVTIYYYSVTPPTS